MKKQDYIDRIYNSIDENDDKLLDERIDFSDKYLPDDREDTKRRIQADTALSLLITAYERNAFRIGFKAAEKLLKGEDNK